jgi:mannose-6-phosphate isomerase class I
MDSIADDYFSTRWFVNEYFKCTGNKVEGVKELAKLAQENFIAQGLFKTFGNNLADFLQSFLNDFKAEVLLIGGNVTKAKDLFLPALEKKLKSQNLTINIVFSKNDEKAAIVGAASFLISANAKLSPISLWRKTEQFILPKNKPETSPGIYDIYPALPLPPDKIKSGFSQLALTIANEKKVIIDGYVGVFWEQFISGLASELRGQNRNVRFYDVRSALNTEAEILEITKIAMGEKKSIFGKRYPGKLKDFFDPEKLALIKPELTEGTSIIYGCGSSLTNWDGLLIYVDVPKNEIQFRSRAGSISNLGLKNPLPPKEMYKRFYFVDWIVLNSHKEKIVHDIDILVDEQSFDEITFISGKEFRSSLKKMSETCFRVKPWFEPGPWGGTWIKNTIQGLAQNVPNYAWSFELIVPENGLLLESSGKLLELSFDFLMYAEAEKVLGDAYEVFKIEFPIRFDFLDTFHGGNLSVQCHPRPDYIKTQFGETFTQDETYYILDAKENSEVYLGFQDNINGEEFRQKLEASFEKNEEIDIPKYVQVHPSKKHDLFLIPNGTIHASGKNNLVLEISSTPYIFTFKMYDWLRLDLDGKPRPINIDHAFKNLYFSRKGEKVKEELISQPRLIEEKNGYRIFHLPTHKEHFYDVHRIEFEREVEIETHGKCHVCMLVEGESIILETAQCSEVRFNYAETFVVPAAAEKYKLINQGRSPVKIVKAFIKDNIRI